MRGKKYIVIPVWKNDTGRYLWGIKEYGLSTIEKYKQYYKKEIKKLTIITKLIIDMFSAQFKKNQSQDKHILSISLPVIFLLKNIRKKIRKTWFEL